MRRLLVALLVSPGLFHSSPARAQPAPVAASDDAVESLGRAIDDHPTADAYDAYAAAAFRAKRWDEAIERLKLGVAQLSTYHAGWYKLGYAYRQKHAFADAAAAYRKYAELEPTKSDPWFGLAAALQGAGDGPGAVSAYEKYIELERAPEKQKFVEQAKAELARLRPPSPKPAPIATRDPVAPTPQGRVAAAPKPAPSANALALRARADQLRRSGKLDDAGFAYEKALAADPGNLELYVELGDVYFASGRYLDAVRAFRGATERDGGYALGWYNLAHAQARAGDAASAVRSYRAYIKLRPSDPDPYYGLAQSCKAAGDRAGAVEAFRTYLQMEHRPELQRWIDRARQELKVLDGSAKADPSDLKNPFDEPKGYAVDDMVPPSELGVAARARIDREIAADDLLPVDLEDDDDRLADLKAAAPPHDRLAHFATALAAYRQALERQTDEVAAIYQRGADRVLADDWKGARRVWTSVTVATRSLDDAKARLERARQALLK